MLKICGLCNLGEFDELCHGGLQRLARVMMNFNLNGLFTSMRFVFHKGMDTWLVTKQKPFTYLIRLSKGSGLCLREKKMGPFFLYSSFVRKTLSSEINFRRHVLLEGIQIVVRCPYGKSRSQNRITAICVSRLSKLGRGKRNIHMS